MAARSGNRSVEGLSEEQNDRITSLANKEGFKMA